MSALVIASSAERILLVHTNIWHVILLWIRLQHRVLAAAVLVRAVHRWVVLWWLRLLLLWMEQVRNHITSWSIELVQLDLYIAVLNVADGCLALLALVLVLACRVRWLLYLPLRSPLILPCVEEHTA